MLARAVSSSVLCSCESSSSSPIPSPSGAAPRRERVLTQVRPRYCHNKVASEVSASREKGKGEEKRDRRTHPSRDIELGRLLPARDVVLARPPSVQRVLNILEGPVDLLLSGKRKKKSNISILSRSSRQPPEGLTTPSRSIPSTSSTSGTAILASVRSAHIRSQCRTTSPTTPRASSSPISQTPSSRGAAPMRVWAREQVFRP